MLSKIQPYAKTAVAVLGCLLLVAKALTDGQVSGEEITAILTSLGVVVGVYQVPNKVK